MMMFTRHTVTLAIVASIMLGLSLAGPASAQIGEGWQFDTFGDNLNLFISPDTPNTDDPMTITIVSTIQEVSIVQANLYVTVYPRSSTQFLVILPFLKHNDSVFRCTIQPFPLNGYNLSFYVVAYDSYNMPMASGSYVLSLEGSGWKREAFLDNLYLTYSPMRANASEEVTVNIRSIDNVTISGANLYITYQVPEGELKEGGWNLTKLNVNSTEFEQVIPGYPAGTNVTFWVTAWDIYGTLTTSKMYNYSVLGIIEYTDFPFEYTGLDGDRSAWVPDMQILIPMAVICALGIPLFIYLYITSKRAESRKRALVTTEQEEDHDGS